MSPSKLAATQAGTLPTVSGATIAASTPVAAWPDWKSPVRIRELSSSRMPDKHELAEIAGMLRRAVAPALDLPYPDPEATRLAALADLAGMRCSR